MERIEELWQDFVQDKRKHYQLAYTVAFVVTVLVDFILPRYTIEGLTPNIYWLALSLSVIVFVWNGLRENWTREQLYAAMAFGLVMILVPDKSNLKLMSFLLLSVSVDPTQDKLIRYILMAKLLIAIGVFFFYFQGDISDWVLRRAGDANLVRHSFGFGHPNSLSMFFGSIALDIALLRKQATNVLVALGLALLGCFVFAVTDSRLVLSIFCVLVPTYLFKNYLEKISVSGVYVFYGILTVFILGISLSFFYQEDSAMFQTLNTLLSGRLANAHAYLMQNSISLFRQTIENLHYASGGRIYNENYYVSFLLNQGLLAYAIFPIMVGIETVKRRFNLYHVIFIMIAFVSAMVEEYGINIAMNSILLFPYFAERAKRPAPREDEAAKLDARRSAA